MMGICPTSGVNTRPENSTYGRAHPKYILALHAATTMFDLRNINCALDRARVLQLIWRARPRGPNLTAWPVCRDTQGPTTVYTAPLRHSDFSSSSNSLSSIERA